MTSGTTSVDIARLMATYNFEIEALTDDLKCTKCKSVLNDAYQVPCGCRFCRTCIDDMIKNGAEFCPGGLQDCGETPLSKAIPDYGAKRSISKLTIKCPQNGCTQMCSLTDIEGHLRVCPRKNVDCPFRELGCLQGKLAADDMISHLQQESRSHSEGLIGLVTKISGDVEILKCELLLKNEQVKHLENENRLTKRQNESLADQVRELSEKLDFEIHDRQLGAEMDCAIVPAMLERMDENWGIIFKQMEPIKNDILSINRNYQSLKDQFNNMKAQVKSIQVPAGMRDADASYDNWLIEDAVGEKDWFFEKSDSFSGAVHPYTYRLSSYNFVNGKVLTVILHILPGQNDSRLDWPFNGAVTMCVADRYKRKACCKQVQQCEVKKPERDVFSSSNAFEFPHSELVAAGLDMSHGVRITCQIVPRIGN